jgi:hypothetical protein
MMMKMAGLSFAAALFALGPAPAQAQAPAASAAKKELVAKVLQLQQPGIEAMARGLIEQPVMQLLQQVNAAMRQRVPQDKRDALGKEIQADVKKYVDETVPVVREQAVRLAPSTVGAVLEEKLTEDELKQVITILESPVNRKFQSLAGEMQRALVEKVVAETRTTVQPKAQALEKTLTQRLAPFGNPPPAPGK